MCIQFRYHCDGYSGVADGDTKVTGTDDIRNIVYKDTET